jgi:hypothetical protein
MGYLRIRRPASGGTVSVPDNALLFFDADAGEYYIITDSLGNILTWETA